MFIKIGSGWHNLFLSSDIIDLCIRRGISHPIWLFIKHVLILAFLESPQQYTQFDCCCHRLVCVSPAERKVEVHEIFKALLFLYGHNLFALSLPVPFIGINLPQIWVYKVQTFYDIFWFLEFFLEFPSKFFFPFYPGIKCVKEHHPS